MRLIDADALLHEIGELKKSPWYNENYCGMFSTRKEAVEIIEDLCINDAPTVDAVEVVRCKDCKWYDSPHIQHNDGSRTDVDENAPLVTSNVGINCGGQCIYHIGLKIHCIRHDREDPDDNQEIIIFRHPNDFCSYGEKR